MRKGCRCKANCKTRKSCPCFRKWKYGCGDRCHNHSQEEPPCKTVSIPQSEPMDVSPQTDATQSLRQDVADSWADDHDDHIITSGLLDFKPHAH